MQTVVHVPTTLTTSSTTGAVTHRDSPGNQSEQDLQPSVKWCSPLRDDGAVSRRSPLPLNTVKGQTLWEESPLARLQRERLKSAGLQTHCLPVWGRSCSRAASGPWWQRSEPARPTTTCSTPVCYHGNEDFTASSSSHFQDLTQSLRGSQILAAHSASFTSCECSLGSLDLTSCSYERSDATDNSFLHQTQYPPLQYSSDNNITICNIFWKSSLTFHSYVHGKRPVDFGALWPGEKELKCLLLESYNDKGLQQLIEDLARLSIFCGPLRLLRVILDLKLLGLSHKFDDGRTLAEKARLARNRAAVVYLAKKGACTDKSGRTSRRLTQSHTIMKVLGQEGFSLYSQVLGLDTAPVKPLDKVKVTPSLHDRQLMFDFAHSAGDIDELLAKLQAFEFDVNKEADEHGDSLVHIATKQGLSHVVLLKMLKDNHRADIDLTNRDGYTCLMLAAMVGNTTLVDTLMCVLGASPDIQNPTTGRTALHYASQRNELEVVSTLLKRGADYNVEDVDGARPDELAAIFRATDCHGVIQKTRAERISKLRACVEQDSLTAADLRASDLFDTDSDGYTLLMLAARHNSTKSLGCLLGHTGVPVNAQHEQTLKTALSYASKFGHSDAVDLLLRHGANPAIKDIEGQMAIHSAIIHHQVSALEVLLQNPAALTGLSLGQQLSTHPGIHKLVIDAIHRRQKNVVIPCLFEGSTSGDSHKVFTTLEDGDCVNPVSGHGDWPMFLAAENGHLEVFKMIHEAGGDMKRRHPQTGNSVLHASCSQGHLEVTEYILAHCQNCGSTCPKEPCGMINALNYRKQTPLVLAAKKGSFRLVSLLLDHGATSSILDPDTGQLFICQFEGLQYIIENHRKQHAKAIMSAIRDRRTLSKLCKVFLPQFDHNLRDHSGDTPLMVAGRLGNIDVVHFLLKTAVYDVFPSPPSNANLSMLCCDSDVDSGNIADLTMTSHCRVGQTTEQDVGCCLTGSGDSQVPHGNGAPDLGASTPQPVEAPEPVLFSLPPEGTEEEEETAMRDNISSLLDSIASVSRGSVFVNHRRVSHICAVNPRDWSTVYHRVIEGGDNVGVIKALLECDQSAVNMQDINGYSPLHRACERGRRRIVQKLLATSYVDLNCRTLNGMLPEETTSNKQIVSMVQKARRHQPVSSSFSLRTSIFGGFSSIADEGSIDFDALNTQFMLLKNDVGSDIAGFL